MKTYLLRLKIFFFSYLLFTFLFINLGYPQEEEIAKFPTRPITFIVSSPAGSIVDMSCRLLCKEAEKYLGKPVIIFNKPGGSMTIGPAAIAAAKPDGYTIGLVQHTSLTVALTEKVPYHPIKSFKQIIQWGGQYMGVSSKGDGPLKSFNDLIAYARQNPKKLTIATTGGKTTTYYFMEYIAKKERLEFTYIPTEGGAANQTAVLGGHAMVFTGAPSYPLTRAGKIRLILLFDEKPSIHYPEVPTSKDLGYDFPAPFWANAAAPIGIPEEIVKRLEDAFAKAMKQPAFIDAMNNQFQLPIVYRNNKEMDEHVSRCFEPLAKFVMEMESTK